MVAADGPEQPHAKALVPTEPLEAWRDHSALHAGGQCAALETVTAEVAPSKADRNNDCLDDHCHDPPAS
jgi:hypothetical protein